MFEPWNETTIGECLLTSFAGEWGSDPKPGNALVFRATDIDDEGRIVGGGAARRLPIGKLIAKQLHEGDILLEGSGGGPDKPVGRVAYFPGDDLGAPAVCSNFFKTLRPVKDKVDPRFLVKKLAWFYTQAPILTLQQQTTGIINLKFEEYLASPITIPPSVLEQSKIAQILDTLDTTIHATEAIIAKLTAVKQGLLHDLLTRGIDANGELRPPQAEAPHLYKESPLGWIPKEWDAFALAKFLVNVGQGWSPDCESIPASLGEWGVLKTTSITWAGYNDQENKALPPALKARPELEVAADDILITRAGPSARVGVVAYVASTREKLMISDKMYRLRLLSTEVPAYIALALSGQAVQSQLGRTLSGMAESQTNISQAIVRNLLVPRPQPGEQAAIVDLISACNTRIRDEESLLNKLTASKSGLMDDLLTGCVRVTPLLEAAAP